MTSEREFRIRAAAKRQQFRTYLENICKLTIPGFNHLTIEWDEKDTEYMEAAKTVMVYYDNGYSKRICVEVDSLRAIVTDVLRWA